jgi:hypothetical protein
MCDVRVFAPPAPGAGSAPLTAAQVAAQFKEEGCTCGFCLPLPRAVYINLDRRHDRLVAMQKHLHESFLSAQRVSGFDASRPSNAAASAGCSFSECKGQVGCQRSHVAVLQAAIAAGWESVMVRTVGPRKRHAR